MDEKLEAKMLDRRDRDTEIVLNTIEAQWDNDTHRRSGARMDWIGMESLLRNIIRLYRYGRADGDEAISLVDDAMAAFTRRGNELPPRP